MTSAGASMFDAAEAHRAVVAIPDPRVGRLIELYRPAKVSPSSVEIVDIPGLSEGSTEREKRGTRLLTHIKEADALIHVVGLFGERDASPVHDVESVDVELMIADAQTLERKIERLGKRVQGGNHDAAMILQDCESVLSGLHDGLPARRQGLSARARASVHDCHLMSLKPVLYVANVDSPDRMDAPQVRALQAFAETEGSEALAVCGREEAEISELPPEERAPFLEDLGLRELSVERILRAAYRRLDLIDFFTAGEREVHVWTCRSGDTAPVAAGKIHTDMERGFIRMETIAYEDLIRAGSESEAVKAGKRRLEGKGYVLQDGDVVVIRFSPPR